jgi:hypothetical protein
MIVLPTDSETPPPAPAAAAAALAMLPLLVGYVLLAPVIGSAIASTARPWRDGRELADLRR